MEHEINWMKENDFGKRKLFRFFPTFTGEAVAQECDIKSGLNRFGLDGHLRI